MDLKFVKPRQQLVDELYEKGIENPDILRAINQVERHKFLHSAMHERAYEDTALPIGKQQTISQPYTVAKQTELLQLKRGEKVLEIGTGSGYQAAILCELGANLYTVERHSELSHNARTILMQLHYKANFRIGDGTKGWNVYAPFDGIIVTAGAPDTPKTLLWQLAIGGRLVIPVGDQNAQKMLRITRVNDEEFVRESFGGFKFVPLIGQEGWDK